MARNIEIKAHIESIASLLPKAAAIASEGPIELIFYRRANLPGPKESFYVRSPTSAPDALRDALSMAYGEIGRVRKHRTLFLVGRTRIHLDRVDGLGDFLELEVVLADDEPFEAGVRETHSLMEKLGIQPSQLIEGAYVDLQSSRSPSRAGGCER